MKADWKYPTVAMMSLYIVQKITQQKLAYY
jgi:hypothetical protein